MWGLEKPVPNLGPETRDRPGGQETETLWVAQHENLASETASLQRQEAETQDHAFDTHSHTLSSLLTKAKISKAAQSLMPTGLWQPSILPAEYRDI